MSDKIKCHECGNVILLKECKHDCKHRTCLSYCPKRNATVTSGFLCQYYESKCDEEKNYVVILITERNGD